MSGFVIAKFDRVRLFTKLWHRMHSTFPFTPRITVVGYNPHGRICIAPWHDPYPYAIGNHCYFDADEFDKLNLLMMV